VIGSQLVAKIYALFNVLCFIVGVVFCFFRGVFTGLGIALVVGSLFALGAFVSQFWLAVHTRESQWIDRMHTEAEVARLQHLARERSELHKQIERLRNTDEPPDGSRSKPAD
jgi:hypothetical protein